MPAPLSQNAQIVLEHRYLLKDERGRPLETIDQMFRRVARAIAQGDAVHEGAAEAARMEGEYLGAMEELLFLPNSPTLMNAGTSLGQLAACFVIPVGDSIPEIFEAVREVAVIHQTGGGTGMGFSRLRPRGDRVREAGGIASGPVSFMRVFDMATDVVKQGGRRRGANMGVLAVSHPDVLEFIHAKDDPAAFTNFNLSVAVSDAFMRAVEADDPWPLVNPRDGTVASTPGARTLWQALVAAAWRTGDPGVLFLDAIERDNPTPAQGAFEATNPCGEQPLLGHEACNLGSINLARLTTEAGVDWERFDRLVRLGVRFLDNVIEVSRYPFPEIAAVVRGNRKIGLGIMGLADALVTLGIPYASERALELAAETMRRLGAVAREASIELAARRGPFPNCGASVWPARGVPAIRNATLTTVAPTGTISIIAGASSGIEPLFALAYVRSVLDGSELPEVNPAFVAALDRLGLAREPILERVVHSGTLQGVPGVPEALERRFMTAFDVPAEWHVRMQAAVQGHVDNGVSKTVNLPHAATEEEVGRIYRLAWRLGCKGVTVFRTGCRGEQVLRPGNVPGFAVQEVARAHAEYAGECRLCAT